MNETNEKQLFDEACEKQSKLAKKCLLITFAIIGTILAALGIILQIFVSNDSYILIIMGGILVLLGVILFFAIPKKYDYERYKKRVKKYGYVSLFELEVKVQTLEAKNKELENRIKALEENKKESVE